MRFLGLASRNFKETYRDRLDAGLVLAIPLVLMLVFGLILKDMPFFGEEFMDFMAPGVIGFGLLILVSVSARLMAMDREKGFLSRLMTTPARPFDFLLGYSLSLVALAIVQIIIFTVVGWRLGMNVAGSPWLLFLIFFLVSLSCIAIGMIVASLCKSVAQAESLSWLFLFPMMLISGAMFPPLEMMPSHIRNIAYAFPFARAIDAARGVNIKGLGLEALSNDLLFLAGFAVVFFTIGVILFRNCLVVSRIRSMFSYALAVVILAGLLCFGFLGGDLRFTGHVSLEAFETPPTPEATPIFEPKEYKEYVNEQYGFSIKYPKDYVEKKLIERGSVFNAHSLARTPIPLPEVAIWIDDVKKGTTFADLRELIRADLVEAFGGTDIEFVSEKETTLADGTTPAHELVVEWSVLGAGHEPVRLKTLILSVIKESKWFSVALTDIANYWPETEAELKEVAYSLQFK